MDRKMETILLVMTIGALTAYLVFRKTEETHYRLPKPSDIVKEEVTRITIEKAGSTITLKRDGDIWRILPEGYRVDGAAVDRMLEIISGLRLTAMASEAENYTVYDLDEADRVEVTAFKGDDPLLALDVGKAAPSRRHTFVKLKDDKRIYHAEKNFRSYFDKDVSSLRDKQVLKIDEEISEMILTAGKKSLHILRATAPVEVNPKQGSAEAGGDVSDQGASRWETVDGKPVPGKEMDGLVKTLSNLKCDDYIEEKENDIGDPTFSVALKGAKNYELFLYGEREGKIIAGSSETDDLFLIPDWKAKQIRKDFDDLLEKKG